MRRQSEGFRGLKIASLVVAWSMVAVGAVIVGLDRFEHGLSESAVTAVASVGVPVASLSVEGRDVIVSGPESSRPDVEAALSSLAGVRRVSWVETGGGDASPRAPGVPVTSTTTSVPRTTSTTVAPQAPVAGLGAVLDKGRLVITGAVPDAEAAGRLGFVADLIYAPFLDNRLEVDESLPAPSWMPNVAEVIAVLPIVSTASLSIEGERASLTAVAPSESRAAQLAGAIAAALGEGVELIPDIAVTGERPPEIEVAAAGDGKVTLVGTMPNRALLDSIVGMAHEVFGADNVESSLVVGEGVHETFSLFRLPLTFPAFKPFQQWHVHIVDDRISGNLRGGATFPSGSARLTPELEQLLQIAAGILSRNPSLLLTVEGHTDAIGSDEDNLALSQRRADAAVRWLVAAGIQPARLFAVGYGETQPIGDNSRPEGRALNRRIEFRLGPPDIQGGTG